MKQFILSSQRGFSTDDKNNGKDVENTPITETAAKMEEPEVEKVATTTDALKEELQEDAAAENAPKRKPFGKKKEQ